VASLGADHGDYYRDLVEAVSQWRDLRALRPLISAGHGMLASQGIIRFGEAAVPLLIEAVRTGHRSEKGGVLLALEILLEGFPVQPYNIPPTPLSSAAREQILRLARDLLRPGAAPDDLQMVAGLALATGDEALRQQLELLVHEPGLIAQFTGLGDPIQIGLVQNGMGYELRPGRSREAGPVVVLQQRAHLRHPPGHSGSVRQLERRRSHEVELREGSDRCSPKFSGQELPIARKEGGHHHDPAGRFQSRTGQILAR
jgi:hypothetical protein